MSVETTRHLIESYAQALLSAGDYARFFSEDVTLTLQGTDRAVSGREVVRQLITFMHTQAFKTDIRVKGVVYGESQAMLEADFVGTHIGVFEGVPASLRDVHVSDAVAYDVDASGITALRLYFPMDQLMRQIGAGERVAETV